MTIFKDTHESRSMSRKAVLKPSSSSDFSGVEEYDKTTFDAVKRFTNLNLMSMNCDRSTPETLQSDDTSLSKANQFHQLKNESDRCTEVYNQDNHRINTTSKEDRIIVNIESLNGKKKMTPTSESGAVKVSRANRSKSASASYGSQLAGQRLYNQAQQRSQRIDCLRQISRTSNPDMKLYTQSYEPPLNWGASAGERFKFLYEHGKNRLLHDKQLRKIRFRESIRSSLNEVTAKYANARLVKIYERGRQKLMNDRKRQLEAIENRAELSDVRKVAGYANTTQIDLHELGKLRIIKGRNISREVVRHSQKSASFASIRLSQLHNLGKRKIVESRDRELEKKMKVRHTTLSDGDLAALHANRRQIILHDIGRENIIIERLNAKAHKEKHKLFSCRLPPRFVDQ